MQADIVVSVVVVVVHTGPAIPATSTRRPGNYRQKSSAGYRDREGRREGSRLAKNDKTVGPSLKLIEFQLIGGENGGVGLLLLVVAVVLAVMEAMNIVSLSCISVL